MSGGKVLWLCAVRHLLATEKLRLAAIGITYGCDRLGWECEEVPHEACPPASP